MSTPYATLPPGQRRDGDVRQRDTHIAMPPSERVRPTQRQYWRRLRASSTGTSPNRSRN